MIQFDYQVDRIECSRANPLLPILRIPLRMIDIPPTWWHDEYGEADDCDRAKLIPEIRNWFEQMGWRVPEPSYDTTIRYVKYDGRDSLPDGWTIWVSFEKMALIKLTWG